MTMVFLLTGTSSFPDPGNWNPVNKVECVGAGCWGQTSSNAAPLSDPTSNDPEVTPLLNQAAGGGGGGAYCFDVNLAAVFPVTVQVTQSSAAPNDPFQRTYWNTYGATSGSVSAGHGFNGLTGGVGGGGASTGYPTANVFAGGGGASYSGSVGGAGGGAAGPHGAGTAGATFHGGASDNNTVPTQTTAGAKGRSGTQWDASHGTGTGGAAGNSTSIPNGGGGGVYGGGGGACYYPTGTVSVPGGDGLIIITYTPLIAASQARAALIV